MTITPPAPVDASVLAKTLRATFDSGRTRPLAWRKEQLAGLRRMMEEGEEELLEALRLDLARPKVEAFAADIGHTKQELRHMAKHVERWMKPTKVRMPLAGGAGQGVDRAGAARRGVGDRAVELPDPAADRAGRRRAGGGQLRARQAVGAGPGLLGCDGPAAPAVRRPGGRHRRRGRGRRDDGAAGRAVGPHLLHRVDRGGARRGGGGRQAPHARRCSSSAASHPRTCTRAPTSMWLLAASRGASSSTPGRPASRPTTSWSTNRSRTASSTS